MQNMEISRGFLLAVQTARRGGEGERRGEEKGGGCWGLGWVYWDWDFLDWVGVGV